jgi:type I restriction enzyme, S subunit
LEGIPVLRMGNILEGRLCLDKLKYLPETHDEFPELFLEPGDLLFNRTNSPELVGKTAVYKGNPSPCSFASYLIRVCFINGVDSNFINYFINSNFGRKWIKSVVSQQVGQANVNGTKLQALSLPLPPFLEQKEIVTEVENKISIIDDVEKEVDINLARADRLRQSILKKAFSGKLVPHDEIDEPTPGLSAN